MQSVREERSNVVPLGVSGQPNMGDPLDQNEPLPRIEISALGTGLPMPREALRLACKGARPLNEQHPSTSLP